MLNTLSPHSKLNSSPSSSQRLLAACSPSSPVSEVEAIDVKMNLSESHHQQNNALGLSLNLSNSSDSSSNGGSGSQNNSHTNLSSHQHHLSSLAATFHQHQQFQQQQLLGGSNNQQIDSIEANKGYTFEEQFKQLYELSDDPKRKEFLDDLFQFMADRNQPVNRIPIMAKQVLDLYELYNLVVARGGLVEVINKKIWREITKGLNLPSSITSAAFTLRTQYMKYLYPYECAKNNFSHQEELQQAIDGNRREGRRAGTGSLMGGGPNGAGYGPYLAAAAAAAAASGGDPHSQLSSGGRYPDSPSPNHHLFAAAAAAAGHNLLSQQSALNQSNHQQYQQQQPLQLRQEPRDLQRPQSGSSSASQSASFTQQRLYQDSIESDHDDEGSIDLGHTSKRNSPIDHELQHLDPHNQHLNQQQSAEQQQQQLAAAAAAAIRQQLGAAINFAGTQNFLGQLTGQTPQTTTPAGGGATAIANRQPGREPNPNVIPGANATGANQGDLLKQQQEQFLAALMTAAGQQQQQQQQPQQQRPANQNPEQQAAARAALSMMASNAMLISASNAPDAMAVATAAQAIGVKGAFIILLL